MKSKILFLFNLSIERKSTLFKIQYSHTLDSFTVIIESIVVKLLNT